MGNLDKDKSDAKTVGTCFSNILAIHYQLLELSALLLAKVGVIISSFDYDWSR